MGIDNAMFGLLAAQRSVALHAPPVSPWLATRRPGKYCHILLAICSFRPRNQGRDGIGCDATGRENRRGDQAPGTSGCSDERCYAVSHIDSIGNILPEVLSVRSPTLDIS